MTSRAQAVTTVGPVLVDIWKLLSKYVRREKCEGCCYKGQKKRCQHGEAMALEASTCSSSCLPRTLTPLRLQERRLGQIKAHIHSGGSPSGGPGDLPRRLPA
ncbi:uncharacterized protein LOC144071669 [Stigmatopora argus]